MEPKESDSTITTLALILFLFFIAVYMTTYDGIFHVFDEEYYGLRAQAFVHRPTIRFFSASTHGLLHNIAAIHRMPFIITLSAFYKAAQALPAIGAVQSMYAVNIFAGAAAVVFIFLAGIELGYSDKASLAVALIYGLCTPAWVYSKTLLREPFVGMLLIGGIYFLFKTKKQNSSFFAIISIIFFLIAISTRISTAAVLPFVGLYLLVMFVTMVKKTLPTSRNIADNKATLALKLTIEGMVAVFLLFLIARSYSLTYQIEKAYMRYLKSYYFFLHFSRTEIKTLEGLLISPGRGLFVYTPPALLALLGTYYFTKKHPVESTVLFLPTLGYFVAVAHYPIWWGGWSWMSRFIVPFLPFLVMPILPIAEKALTSKKTPWYFLLLILSFLGLLIQILGVTVGIGYLSMSSPQDPSGAFSWKFAPFVWQFLQHDFHHMSMNLAIFHIAHIEMRVIILIAYAVSTLLLLSLLRKALRKQKLTSMRFTIIALTLSLLSLIMMSLAVFYKYDDRYKAVNGYLNAITYIKHQAVHNEDALVVDCYLQDELYTSARVMNFCKGDCPPHQVITREVWEKWNDDQRSKQLNKTLLNKARAWLIPTDLPPGSPQSQVEQWMDQHYFKQSCKWTGKTIRVCLYYLPPKAKKAEVVASNATFGDRIRLLKASLITSNNGSGSLHSPGDPLLISFYWQALKPMHKNYKVTLQMLDSKGKLRAQLDREIGDGFWPTSSWTDEKTIHQENYAFVIPTNLPPGNYTLYLGVYDPDDGKRLTPMTSLQTTADMIKLMDIKVGNAK